MASANSFLRDSDPLDQHSRRTLHADSPPVARVGMELSRRDRFGHDRSFPARLRPAQSGSNHPARRASPSRDRSARGHAGTDLGAAERRSDRIALLLRSGVAGADAARSRGRAERPQRHQAGSQSLATGLPSPLTMDDLQFLVFNPDFSALNIVRAYGELRLTIPMAYVEG